MKKKLIPVAVIAVLLAGMAGLLVWLGNQEEPEEEIVVESDTVYILGGEQSLAVSRVEIENETGSFAVDVDNSGDDTAYTVEGWESIEQIKGQLSGLISSSSALAAKEIVAEEGGDPAVFGLTSPRAKVKIVAEEESPVLLVGDDAPAGQGIYVKREDDPAIYLVASSSGEKFLADPLSFVNLTLSGGDSESTSFERAVLSGSVREESIVVEALSEDESTSAGGMMLTSHQITAPVSTDLDSQYGWTALMSGFGLSADAAVAVYPTEEELESFGLAEPYSILQLTSEETGSFTLAASQPEGGLVYVQSSNRPDVVYLVAADQLVWLESQVFDLRGKLVILPYIDSIAQVTVTTPGSTHVFGLSGEGDDLEVTVDGGELDPKIFRKFYQTLISASYRDQLEEEISLEGVEPVMEFVYEYRDSTSTDRVRFYEGTARRFLIQLNDQSPEYVESTYVDRVQADVEKVAAGEEVSTYI